MSSMPAAASTTTTTNTTTTTTAAIAPAKLNRLNSTLHIAHPSDAGFDPEHPSVVLLFGWFQANLAHVKKYAEVFQSLWPTSTVLVVMMDQSWLFSSQAQREALLTPVADTLDDLERKEGPSFRGVFLHVMSNGGGMQLLTLSKVLAKRARTFTDRYPVALAMDSAPDDNSMRCMVVAFTSSLRNPVAKVVTTPLIAFLYCIFHVHYGRGVLPELRRRLLSPNLIPFRRQPATNAFGEHIPDPTFPADSSLAQEVRWIPRLYICSKADQVTQIKPILKHVEESRRAGFDVRTEIFERTAHVSHAKGDPARYWGAVQQVWRDASLRTATSPLLIGAMGMSGHAFINPDRPHKVNYNTSQQR